MNDNITLQEKVYANVDSLKQIAIFLEGLKLGRGGNILPLGTVLIDDLWTVIRCLNFDGKIETMPKQ